MTGYLFDPERVDTLLEGLPALRAALPASPASEGEPSESFPGARRSERQLYRILGNVHYPHLNAMVRTLDRCVEAGYRQPSLWRTRAVSSLGSAISELGVAEHLLLRGFRVEGLDEGKATGTVPDILAKREDEAVAVEVYAPRDREGLDDLVDELKDDLKHLDLAFDYRFGVRVDPLDPAATQFVHPVLMGLGERRATRAAVMSEVVPLVETGAEARVDLPLPEQSVRALVDVEDVRPSTGRLPDRSGLLSPPTRVWPEPTSVFTDLADRVVKKLRDQQAPRSGLAPRSALVVDLMGVDSLSSHLNDPSRQEAYGSDLERLETRLSGYDLAAFCGRWEWESEHVAWASVTGSPDAEKLLAAFFG